MTNASKGRVGVAPSRERCPVCGDRAQLAPNMDGERVCQPCCDIYVTLVADNNAAIERELLGDRGTEEPLIDGAALEPWYRAIARWALDDSRQP